MARKSIHSILALITATWAILLPMCLSGTAAIFLWIRSMRFDPLYTSIGVPVIIITCIILTGATLGIPLSYSLASFYKSSSPKWIFVCLGWAFAFFIAALIFWLIISGTQYNEGQSANYTVASIFGGSMFFAALSFIPGAIGGGIIGLIERRLLKSTAPHRTFLLSMAWALALSSGSGTAYLILALLSILFPNPATTISFISLWGLALVLAISGAISGAIGSALTFSYISTQREENHIESLMS